MGYIQSLNEPNVELFSDDAVVKAEGTTVFTEKGHELRADVVILATGFKVRDCEQSSLELNCVGTDEMRPDMFPLKLYNSEGESLQDRMKETGSKVFQGTCVSSFPNFFWLMGPNTTTGHSSVIFTSECQLSLAFHMIRPVVAALRSDSQPISSRSTSKAAAPFVEVTRKAEDERYARLRKEMRNKTWETNGGVSWYTDKQSGLCTASSDAAPAHGQSVTGRDTDETARS